MRREVIEYQKKSGYNGEWRKYDFAFNSHIKRALDILMVGAIVSYANLQYRKVYVYEQPVHDCPSCECS